MSRRYDDDYEGSSFEKFTNRKPKKHKKGHQSRSGNSEKRRWSELEAMDEVYTGDRFDYDITKPNIITSTTTTQKPKPTETPARTEHQFGENTHEIKGVKIDFDGVADIQKVENAKDGVTTYGIKFLFKGKKGLYRIIWYNTNFRARDTVYNTEYAFWLTIRK